MRKNEVLLLLLLTFLVLSYSTYVYSLGGGVGIFLRIVSVDTTAPEINITILNPTSGRNINVTGTYSEENNNIKNITVEVNSSHIVLASIDTGARTWNATINLTEGWNRFYVLAYDTSGNFANITSSSQGASILSDTTKPVINLTAPANESEVANSSLITFTISDLFLSDAFYKVSEGSTTSFNSIYELTVGTDDWVENETNYVIVNATDTVNNVEKVNYTFTYANNYAVVLEASITTTEAEISATNDTVNELQDTAALESLVNDFAAEITVEEYNDTLEALDVVEELNDAVSSIEILLQEILNANSTGEDNATKTATINAKLEEIKTIKNTTVSSVDVNLFNENLTVEVSNTTTSNVTDELAAVVTGLSAADKVAFEEASEALQEKTTITNKVQTLTQTFLNGRTQNITLFEKIINISETQSGEFYVNEFIDKNITGNNDLNADSDVTNRISTPLTVVVADPIVRWSFSDTTGAVIKFTVDKNVPAGKVSGGKTVLSTVPTVSDGSSSDSGTTVGGGGTADEAGGGAGDVSDKTELLVSKENLKIVLKQTETKEETFSIKNIADTETEITVILDDIKDLVSKESLDFFKVPIKLLQGEEKEIAIIFTAPEDMTPDIYPFKIILRSILGFEKKLNGIVEVESAKPLFDVDIEVLPQYKSVFPGEEIFLEVSLFNIRGFGRVDVNLEYSIKDFEGKLITSEQETVAIETQAKFSRDLSIPSDTQPGTYIASVKVTFEDSVGISSDLFEVKAKSIRLYPVGLKNQSLFLIPIIIVLILGVPLYIFKRLKKKKPKTKEEEHKMIRSEEKVKKLERQLEALEKGYKSKMISEISYKKGKERIEKNLKKLRKE